MKLFRLITTQRYSYVNLSLSLGSIDHLLQVSCRGMKSFMSNSPLIRSTFPELKTSDDVGIEDLVSVSDS